jgi:hypothetical protein
MLAALAVVRTNSAQEGNDSLEAEDVPTPEWIDVERVVYRHRAA